MNIYKSSQNYMAVALTAILLLLFLVGCSQAGASKEAKTYPEGTIASVLAADGRFTILLEIVDEIATSTTTPILVDPELPYTLFAPTDDAFAAMPPELLDQLMTDKPLGGELLFHHLFDRPLYAKDFTLLPSWPTYLTPVHVAIKNDEGVITYDGATVIQTDIEAGKGVIHVLDAVTGIDLLTD